MTVTKGTGLEQPELRKLLGKPRHKCNDGSETWTIEASDTRRITAAQMKYSYSRIHLGRLQNKYTNCKGVKK